MPAQLKHVIKASERVLAGVGEMATLQFGIDVGNLFSVNRIRHSSKGTTDIGGIDWFPLLYVAPCCRKDGWLKHEPAFSVLATLQPAVPKDHAHCYCQGGGLPFQSPQSHQQYATLRDCLRVKKRKSEQNDKLENKWCFPRRKSPDSVSENRGLTIKPRMRRAKCCSAGPTPAGLCCAS